MLTTGGGARASGRLRPSRRAALQLRRLAEKGSRLHGVLKCACISIASVDSRGAVVVSV